MTAATADIAGLTGLRRVDPDADALGASLAAIMAMADLEVSAAASDDIAGGGWFQCSGGVSFRIVRINGQRPPSLHNRVENAVAVLDAIDPLLGKLENALDVDLDANALGDLASGDRVVLDVTNAGSQMLLAVPLGHPKTTDWHSAAKDNPPRADDWPLMFGIDLTGPRLSVQDASALDKGDMLLIGTVQSALLVWEGAPPTPGAYDLRQGAFVVAAQGGNMADIEASKPGDGVADFAVPLTIRLAERMTSAATLAALRPGTTLPLGPLTDSIPVTLLVANRPLAHGELVQLGDRFAVLIEDKATIADPVEDEKAQAGVHA